MARLILICFLTMISGFSAARAGPPPRNFLAEGARFEISEKQLWVFFSPENDSLETEVWINPDGELSIDGRALESDRGDRKQLRNFVKELSKLSELMERVSADVSAQMDSTLSDSEQRGIAKRMFRTGNEVEKTHARIASVAIKLLDRYPELEALLVRFRE